MKEQTYKESILVEMELLKTEKEAIKNNVELSFIDVDEWAAQKYIIDGKIAGLEWCLNNLFE